MKKLKALLIIGISMCSIAASAQNIEHQIVASQYGSYQVPTVGQGYSFPPASCQIAAGGKNFPAFARTVPIKIVDSNPAQIEVVTPVAVNVNNNNCSVSMNTTYSHISFYLTSGTGGLQESLNAGQVTGGANTVILDQQWYSQVAPSTPATVIAAVKGTTALGIVDVTTAPYTWYSWNGSNYVFDPIGGGAGVASFNTRTGAVVPVTGDYTVAQVTGAAPIASPTLTGVPLSPTLPISDNNQEIVTSAAVNAAGYAPLASPAFTGTPTAPTVAITTNNTQLATTSAVSSALLTYAPLTNANLTGTPTAPTQPCGSNGDIATGAYVANCGASAGVNSFNTRQGNVTAQSGDYTVAQVTNAAPLTSPAFTGIPTAPTQAITTNNTFLATTQAVTTALIGYAPLASPTFTGTPLAPTKPITDNNTEVATTGAVTTALGSYAPLASPALTGVPTAPTAANGTDTTQVATTAFDYNNFLYSGGNYNSTQATQTPTSFPAVGTIWQVDGFPSGTARGAWSSATAYNRFDTVTNAGVTWIALNGSTNVTPVQAADGAAQFWAQFDTVGAGLAATQADTAFYWAWEQVQVHATAFGAYSSVGLVFGDKTGGYAKNGDWTMPTNAFGYTISLFGQGRGQTRIYQNASTLNFMINSPNVTSSGGQTIQGINLDANLLAGGCLSHHLRRSVVSDVSCWDPQQQATGTVGAAMWLGSGADDYESKYEHLLVRTATYSGLVAAYGTATVTAGAITGITWGGTGTNLNLPVTAGPGLVAYFTGKGASSTSYQPCGTMPVVSAIALTGGSINTGTGVGGFTFSNAGATCGGTIYVRVQQAGTLNQGFYLNGADTTIEDIVTSGDFKVSCEFVNGPFSLLHEHPYCAAPYQIQSAGNGVRNHIATEMDSPIQYGMYITGSGATVTGGFAEYNAGQNYGAGDYLIDAAATNFSVASSGCYSGSVQNFGGYTKYTGTTSGALTPSSSALPASASISGVQENCDGTASLWGTYPANGGANFPSSAGVVYNTTTSAARNATPSDLLPLVGYYTGAYSGSTTYKFGDEASDGSGNNYVSLAAANTGNALTNVTWWHFLGGVSSTITGGNCVTPGNAMTGISTAGVPVCGPAPYTITASSTPAISFSNGSLQMITLTSAATATVTGITAGAHLAIQICQGSTVYAWTWPAAIHGGICVGPSCTPYPSQPNTCSMQTFNSYTGTTLVPENIGVVNVAP